MKPLYKVGLVEDEYGHHFYAVDNDPTFLPGVTGILDCISKAALVPWAAKETALYFQRQLDRVKPGDRGRIDSELWVKRAKKQPRFIKEKAADVGTEAHRVFDSIVSLQKEPYGTTPFMPSFKHWMDTEKLRILKGDTKVASIEYGYGGSLDALAIDQDRRLVILDFKTGKNIYETHALQVAAYSQAFKETYGIDYRPNGVIIRFENGKPKYERREVRDINDSFSAFYAAHELSKALKLVHFQNKELVKLNTKKQKEKVPHETAK